MRYKVKFHFLYVKILVEMIPQLEFLFANLYELHYGSLTIIILKTEFKKSCFMGNVVQDKYMIFKLGTSLWKLVSVAVIWTHSQR